nr:hypothetical protein [Bacteroides intestinalis]
MHRILSLSGPYLLRVYTLGLGTELVWLGYSADPYLKEMKVFQTYRSGFTP